jgi:hypothetical protein
MYKLPQTVRSSRGQDGAVLMDIPRGKMFVLNFVGSKIFELLMSGASESQIAIELSRDFDIDGDRALNDVLDFTRTLERHHLIENLDFGSKRSGNESDRGQQNSSSVEESSLVRVTLHTSDRWW